MSKEGGKPSEFGLHPGLFYQGSDNHHRALIEGVFLGWVIHPEYYLTEETLPNYL